MSNTPNTHADISPAPMSPRSGQAGLSNASYSRVGCGQGLVEAGRKLSTECGNIWLEPDTDYSQGVGARTQQGGGRQPQGENSISQSFRKNKQQRNHPPPPRLHHHGAEMSLSLNLAGRISNVCEQEEGSRRMAKPHRPGPGQSGGGIGGDL